MTTWDYTPHAATYSMRAPYAAKVIDRLVGLTGARPRVADIGAGDGHLTLDLAERGCEVDAVEPNEAMAEVGRARTGRNHAVRWSTGTGEQTRLPTAAYDLVTFGSSFNTTDRAESLREAARLLHDRGYFACIWNHRQLDDPLQATIEALIKKRIPGYSHGTRRGDQGVVIAASGLFGPATRVAEPFTFRTSTTEWVDTWYSHATLQRQAGESFKDLVEEIGATVRTFAGDHVEVPYTTVGWYAARAPRP